MLPLLTVTAPTLLLLRLAVTVKFPAFALRVALILSVAVLSAASGIVREVGLATRFMPAPVPAATPCAKHEPMDVKATSSRTHFILYLVLSVICIPLSGDERGLSVS